MFLGYVEHNVAYRFLVLKSDDTSAGRGFGPRYFWHSSLVPKLRHIRTRPKRDGLWLRV